MALLLIGTPLTVLADAGFVPGPVTVCYGFECGTRQDVQLSSAQWSEIRGLFMPDASSAEHERNILRAAIAKMEDFTGALTGSADLGGNVAGSGLPKQMDCIDESTNTTAYINLLQQNDLLIWHDVAERRRRSKWIIDVHWTAVIREKSSGQYYAVDSWYLDNGKPPYIQRLEDWQAKKDFN
jgi:hypothetical protein